jgi:hypothetical protein
MKRTLYLFLLTALPFSGLAQVDFTAINGPYNNIGLANYFPSMLGGPGTTVHVDLFRLYGYAGASFIGPNYLEKMIDATGNTEPDRTSILTRIANKSRFFGGAQVQPLNVAINTKKFSIGFGAHERVENILVLDGEFVKLLWLGNKQFAGQDVPFDNSNLNLSYFREMYLSTALNVLDVDDLKVRVGGRLKYMQGMTTLSTSELSGSLYTHPEGKYLDVTLNTQLNYSGPVNLSEMDSMDNFEFQPFKSSGSGFGLDLGANVQLTEVFHFALGITDLGAIRYNRNAANYSINETYRFQGASINNIINGVDITDSTYFRELIKYQESDEAFSVPNPARLSFQAAYRIMDETSRGKEYYKFSVMLTIIQGLSFRSTFSDMNFIMLGVNGNFANIASIGGNLGISDFRNPMMGINAGLKLGPVRMGGGTSNFLPLFLGNASGGSDFHIHLGLIF